MQFEIETEEEYAFNPPEKASKDEEKTELFDEIQFEIWEISEYATIPPEYE